MPILVDATECKLVDGYMYYMSARLVTTKGKKGRKVGIVKCLFDQGYVTKIHHPDEKQENRTIHARNKCHGIAQIVFADTGNIKFQQVDNNNEILIYKGEGNVE
jgi:hypothetical protein